MRRLTTLGFAAIAILAPVIAAASPAAEAEGHDAAGGHAAGAEAHGGYADIEWFTPVFGHTGKVGLVWILINFAVLMWLLEKLLFSKLRASTKRKHEEARDELAKATSAREQAEATLAECEGRLTGLEQEIDGLIEEAKSRAEADRARIIEDAEREATAIKAAATASAEREAESRRRKLEAEVVERAIERAEAVIRKQIGAGDQRKMADEFIVGLADVDFGS
jgi:F-type H+-transporting ATPase subunit b